MWLHKYIYTQVYEWPQTIARVHNCKATKTVLHSSSNSNAYHQKRMEKEDRQGKSTKQVKQIPIKEKTHQKHLNYQTSFPGFKLIFKSKLQSVRI
jgi:hypothetical protein